MDINAFLKDVSDKICKTLPENLQGLKHDLEKNVQGVLNNAFTKLDLVAREEFEAQTKVLARTRQKVEALEAKVAELEKALQDLSHD